MKRIAIFEAPWWIRSEPNKSDFEAYDAHILISKSLSYYAINKNNKVTMIHPYQINDIAVRNNINIKFKEFMCQAIDNLPEYCWQQVIEQLHLKQ
ncbi:MAG: hypothetical protein ACK5Z5_06600 [Neisseriaceae bacterium]|jgi:predicted urease superfamily metal-dependent hydrolase